MSKFLIVNADDLGLSSGVDRGIVEAHEHGIVTSTTALANLPGAAAGIALVQRRAPTLGLGLHLNLTFGRPLLPPEAVPSLVGADGRFVGVTRGFFSTRRWHLAQVRLELEAQLGRFVELTGGLPDHLDSHQLVGSLSPVCRAVMLDLADTHALPVRRGGLPGLRVEREPSWGGHSATSLFKTWSTGTFMGVYARVSLEPDALEVRFFDRGATPETLLRILSALPVGVTELVCHPGYLDVPADAYRGRETELRALTDPRMRREIEERGIQLMTFRELLELKGSAPSS
ncbi:chitin disaccharide deacetylase [soil metagenome]